MTFSIVARDPFTGALGVATATGGPVVGSLVPHARAGVGAVATQSSTNPFYGFRGLDRMARGEDPEAVLAGLVAADPDRARRQCAMIDAAGRTACWTGEACNPYAATLTAPDVAVAGNMIAGPGVLEAMIAAFAPQAPLEERLLAALEAGEAAGGDRRGTRSAALKIYTSEPYPFIDLRADWSDAPIAHLGAILGAVRDADYADFFRRVPREGG